MIGQTVSHYEVEAEIGRGGMGEVYKALDTRLRRPVALKFLSPTHVRNPVARARFVKEAQAASILDHPNICTIFEIDELSDGGLFIAMAFCEGETLEDRITRGPLVAEEVMDISLKVARGLQQAHQQRIVHRDIKPGNVMVAPGGGVKILDFGVAKHLGDQRLTDDGKALGTIHYMAPENLKGVEIDHRCDIWSLGVMMFEMLTGQVPFRGASQSALMYSILMDEPELLGGSTPTVLEAAIHRALCKEPEDRYQHVDDLIAELERGLERPMSATIDLRPPPARRGRSIAVLPFTDLSPGKDQGYFCTGLAEELVYSLAQVPTLRVASRTTTASLPSGEEDVRLLGRKLKVDSVLQGSVRKAGDRLRVTVQLTKVTDGFQLWSERYDRRLEDVFEVQDEIARTVVEALKLTLGRGDGEKAPSPPVPKSSAPRNIEAFNRYLRGRHHWNKRTEAALKMGIECFREAIELEPTYARAYAGLADSYSILGIYGALPPEEVMPRAKAAAEQALAIDPNLAEVLTSRGYARAAYDWDFAGARTDFLRAVELDPQYATAYHWYSVIYLMPLGYFEDSLRQLQKALELEPLSLVLHSSVALNFYYSRQFERAVVAARKALELDQHFAMAHFTLGLAHEQLGQYPESLKALRHARQLSGESPEMTAALAYVSAVAGQEDEALQLLGELRRLSEQRYISPVLVAQVFVGLGRIREALSALELAFEGRAADLIWLGVRPIFDPLRSEPAFRHLLTETGLLSLSAETRVR